MSENVKTSVSENTNENNESSENNVNISIVHLQNMVKIIELASSRGCFRANELENVGSTYNTLVEFLDKVKKNE